MTVHWWSTHGTEHIGDALTTAAVRSFFLFSPTKKNYETTGVQWCNFYPVVNNLIFFLKYFELCRTIFLSNLVFIGLSGAIANLSLRQYLAILGYLGLSQAISSSLWQSLITLAYLGLSMAILGYIWLSLAISGDIRLSLAISGYLWLSLAISGYLWLSLVIYIKTKHIGVYRRRRKQFIKT